MIKETISNGIPKKARLENMATELAIPSPNKDRLRRVFRYLAHENLLCMVEEDGECRYGLTPASKLLVQGQEKSLDAFVMFTLQHEPMAFLEALYTAVPERQMEVEDIDNEKWKWAEEDGGPNAQFVGSMEAHSSMVVEEIVRAMEKLGSLEGVGTLVDVGGNVGQVAGAIAKAFPL